MKKQSLNCGSCIFLGRERAFERKCTELGKLPSSKSCATYKPDVFTLCDGRPKVKRLGVIANAIHELTPSELQTLGAVLHAERTTRKFGWRFYQRVYIRFTGQAGANYFSNFAVGHVVYADKDYIRIVGDSGKLMVTAVNDGSSSTIYTLEQFKVLSAQMTKAKHFNDPRRELEDTKHTMAVPLDDILDSDKPLGRKLVKSKARTDDLVSLISKLSNGIMRPTRKSIKGQSKEIVMSY